MGGCRVDKKDIYDNLPSTANVPELEQTFEDVAHIKPRPDYFFFLGDLVFGYTKTDTSMFASELNGWKKIYEQSELPKTGIRMVTIPGNHEFLTEHDGNVEVAYERQWERIMAPFIAGSNGPGIGGEDSLPVDESKETYSFDYKNTHFVVMNTDGGGKECKADAYWADKDISKARQNGAKHIFVLSHIPCYGPKKLDEDADLLYNRDQLWQTFENNNVEAMMSSHIHIFYAKQPHEGKTWMVISGNGGSPLNKEAKDKKKYFGYTLVKVYKSGRVLCYSYGRDVPKDGYNKPVDSKTTLRDSCEVTWGTVK